MLFGGCKVIWKMHSQAGAWERAGTFLFSKLNEKIVSNAKVLASRPSLEWHTIILGLNSTKLYAILIILNNTARFLYFLYQ